MPTHDRLSRELVQLALDYHALRPWTRITPEAPFLVRVPGEDDPLACFVLGRTGEQVGLGILRGPGMPDALGPLLAGEEIEECARLAEVLNVSFGPRHLLRPADLRLLEAAGHTSRRDAAVPVFGCFDRRDGFRLPRRPQLRAMGAALRATLAADRAGKLVPRDWDPRRRRALELEGRGKRAQVLDRVVVVPGGEVTRTRATDLFPGRWEGAYEDLPTLDAEWIVGRAPVPVADEEVVHDFLTVLEGDSGVILAGGVLTPCR